MRANRRSYILLAGLIVAVAAGLGWQRQTAAGLRGELARQHAQGQERARLTTENQRLTAAQATAEELDQVIAERTAVAQLRTELAAMQRRAREASAAPRPPTAAAPPALAGHALAFQLWQDAGQATPAAAFESILWASASGNIETLARLLAFDPESRLQANALFAQLPESVRTEFVSPERLIAFLTAKDVPLGSATILGQHPSATGTMVVAQIFDAEGRHKISLFSLRAEGADWRLVVPANAVKRYAAWLRAPPGAAGSPP